MFGDISDGSTRDGLVDCPPVHARAVKPCACRRTAARLRGLTARARPKGLPGCRRRSGLSVAPGEIIRTVGRTKAYINFKGRLWPVGQAFFGERLAIRPRAADGQYGIYLGAHEVASIDLTKPAPVSQVSNMSPH